MNKIKWLYFTLAIFIGEFMFVYGEIDDSPGGQLLGLLLVIISVVYVLRSKRKM